MSRYIAHSETVLRYAASTMAGRPREHDEQTARALLDEAERLVEAEGAAAVTVRRVADGVGVSTRAVYSVYGSKDGLLVALGARGFEMLGKGVAARPRTDDPAADLVEAGVMVFRRFAVEHPALFQIAIQWAMPDPRLARQFADVGMGSLVRAGHLDRAGRGSGAARRPRRPAGGPRVPRAVRRTSRNRATRDAGQGDEERVWRDALSAGPGFATT